MLLKMVTQTNPYPLSTRRTLEDEKRNLVMKASVAATETQKAKQRSWDLEEEVARVQKELTATKLALQQNKRRSEFLAGLSASSNNWYDVSSRGDTGKENMPRTLAFGVCRHCETSDIISPLFF